LKPLPAEPFHLSEWSRARVNIDYHVSFDANLYSVPYSWYIRHPFTIFRPAQSNDIEAPEALPLQPANRKRTVWE
jgi:hypothetical protein